ncbi:MAG: DUF1566 domain-containing protein [Bacteroidetes bacterium]|nr:DUF1566 domain-containing protein [Bacteroidota bacterium]
MKNILLVLLTINSIYSNGQNSSIGVPIRFKNLEISQYTFTRSVNWFEALEMGNLIGGGWKLPSKEQLDTLYKNKNIIGGFVNDAYWSSTNNGVNTAWRQYFSDGDQVLSPKEVVGYVRLIRILNTDSIGSNVFKYSEKKDSLIEQEIDGIREGDEDDDVRVNSEEDIVVQGQFSKGIPLRYTMNSPSDIRYYSEEELKKLNNPKYIIGTPIQIGKLLISQHEFPKKMNWVNAKFASQKLGPGWRLPTNEELNVLFKNQTKIKNFSKVAYWSLTEGNDTRGAWVYSFIPMYGLGIVHKLSTWGVRAVKSL